MTVFSDTSELVWNSSMKCNCVFFHRLFITHEGKWQINYNFMSQSLNVISKCFVRCQISDSLLMDFACLDPPFLIQNKGYFNRFQLEAQGLTNICLVQNIYDTCYYISQNIPKSTDVLISSLNQPFTEWFNQVCCLWIHTGQQQGQEGVKVQSAPVTVTVGNISSTSPDQMGQVQSPSDQEGQPSKRLRRVACSCPNCRDGEGRYVSPE